MNTEETRERAKKILGKYDINIMKSEEKIINVLYDIIEKKNITLNDERKLDDIEEYLNTKLKMSQIS